jgi:hypothetical protein
MNVAVAISSAQTPVEAARAALAEAFAARADALSAAEAARQAVSRSYLNEMAAEASRLSKSQTDSATAAAASISAALKAGRSPVVALSPDVPSLAASLALARSALASAELAAADLSLDENAAEEAALAAESAIQSAVKAVIAAEATVIAERIEELRTEEADLVEKIGLSTYFVGKLLNPPNGSPLWRAMGGIIWLTNGREMQRSQAYSARWRASLRRWRAIRTLSLIWVNELRGRFGQAGGERRERFSDPLVSLAANRVVPLDK